MEIFECHICKTKSTYAEDFEECDECGELTCIDCSVNNFGETICYKCYENQH